jgi:hypothetical protein
MDIYVSFKQEDDSWGTPKNLGENINSAASDWKPVISPDGKYLFFSSYRLIDPEILNGSDYKNLAEASKNPRYYTGTLYWVSSDVVFNLKGVK